LRIKTFNVVPISDRLGTLEWVGNTEPMKSLISKEHKRTEFGKDIFQSRAYTTRMKWLEQQDKGKKNVHSSVLHLKLLGLSSDSVVEAFEEH
jgi:phosphatidylinositol kinase/protein kinase (PI-3  family)